MKHVNDTTDELTRDINSKLKNTTDLITQQTKQAIDNVNSAIDANSKLLKQQLELLTKRTDEAIVRIEQSGGIQIERFPRKSSYPITGAEHRRVNATGRTFWCLVNDPGSRRPYEDIAVYDDNLTEKVDQGLYSHRDDVSRYTTLLESNGSGMNRFGVPQVYARLVRNGTPLTVWINFGADVTSISSGNSGWGGSGN